MEFPRFVFTAPGPLRCNGGTYGQHIVADQTHYDAAIKAGFFATLPEALVPPAKKVKVPNASEIK